ncbi:hypothetical protein HELRODRAFT_63009, partial [Helobdella robusta]|uniref:Homeobox domain-containing protein n=1 Tax=Helobdella robusta TaxID=6412 RepID=T1FX96_HELRO
HPLFALISFLFERCDQSTASSVSQPIKNIDNDINNHFMKLHQEETPIFTEDSDVDNLMIETLKVLKIHLIELEKVHDLCKDFCSRYIRCLKTSMHSSQLVPIDLDDDNEASIEIPNADSSLMSPLKSPLISTNLISPISNLGQGQVVSGGTVYQMVQTPQGLAVEWHVSHLHIASADTQIFMNSDDDSQQKKSKRGVLPKKATKVMKAWLFQHLSHPYPNEDEKRQIASQTNLTILQVNNWFINGRRRILQPMMNSSNELAKHKPKRHNKKSAQRFWPPTSSAEQAGGEEEEEEEEDEEDNEEETDEEVRHSFLRSMYRSLVIRFFHGSVKKQQLCIYNYIIVL